MKLEPSDSVLPSTYNPRKADAARLELVELSLRKLGWLLAIYADESGEIVSGHQRHHVATTKLGLAQVPVVRLRAMELDERKALNVYFNRGTCDMDAESRTVDMRKQILASRALGQIRALPDVRWDHPEEGYPCLFAEELPLAPILQANAGRWKRHAKLATRALVSKGAVMPVVLGPGNRIVNGVGRVEYAAERGETRIFAVQLSAERAEVAGTMLNLLSMDFDIAERYEKLLRYNSFRRVTGKRRDLGIVWVFFAFGRVAGHAVDISDRATSERWKARHGTSVLDFGAGHGTECALVSTFGVRTTMFEPYRLTPDTTTIDLERSVAGVRTFLRDVAAGVKWDSIFLATVLNSVPFGEDRRHILRLCAALASRETRLFLGCSSDKHPNWRDISKVYANEENAKRSKFVLDYEPGITLGDARRPKVQKYHTQAEVGALCRSFWADVELSDFANLVMAECSRPRRVKADKLRESIAFEFDLPYPGDQRMGLVAEAMAAFEARGCFR